jgi:hypothetical protein
VEVDFKCLPGASVTPLIVTSSGGLWSAIQVGLATPSGLGRFTVAPCTADGLVLLLGENEARTPLPWQALEQVPDLLRVRGWVLIGGTYSMGSTPGSLDEHLKGFLKRATAG